MASINQRKPNIYQDKIASSRTFKYPRKPSKIYKPNGKRECKRRAKRFT